MPSSWCQQGQMSSLWVLEKKFSLPPPGFFLMICHVPWLAGVSLKPILMWCTPRACDCSWMLLEMTVHGGAWPLLSCHDLILTSYI